MIVRDIMTTKLVTVEPDDTLSHAANLLRQYQFHHLPVTHAITIPEPEHKDYQSHHTLLQFEGLLTAQDIDLVAALDRQNANPQRPWQEKRVVEVMHRAIIRVTPNTSVAAAAQMMVERNLNYLPVVEYSVMVEESKTLLVGLLTRSDLLIALARAMGAFEPGMQVDIALPTGDITPLIETLHMASELHMQIRSIMAAPLADGTLHLATLRLGTINPSPLLIRLQAAGIQYAFANPLAEDDAHV